MYFRKAIQVLSVGTSIGGRNLSTLKGAANRGIMTEALVSRLALELDASARHVRGALELMDQGCTVPFVARQ